MKECSTSIASLNRVLRPFIADRYGSRDTASFVSLDAAALFRRNRDSESQISSRGPSLFAHWAHGVTLSPKQPLVSHRQSKQEEEVFCVSVVWVLRNLSIRGTITQCKYKTKPEDKLFDILHFSC